MLARDTEPRMIVFAGTVGAGKTTQMKLLASKLRTNGIGVKTAFLKTGHLPAYLLEVLLARIVVRGSKYASPIRALIEEKPHLFRTLFKLWLALDIIGVSLKFLFKIHIPVKTGCLVLVEEYIPATVVDYISVAKAVGLPPEASSFASKFMSRLQHLGGPAQVIFLDADPASLKSRWRLRKQQDERSEYLRMQRTTLLLLSKRFSSRGLIYVDTTNLSIEKVHELIMDNIEEIWPTRRTLSRDASPNCDKCLSIGLHDNSCEECC